MTNTDDENLRGKLIPNAVKIPPFKISHDGFTSVDGHFYNVSLIGLQSIEIDNLATDFVEMEVSVGIAFAGLVLKGYYELEIGAGFWSYEYEGGFSLTATDLTASGNAYLNVSENATLVVGDVDIELEVNTTSVEFENLLGGSSFVSGVINQLSGMLFDAAKTEIITEIKKIVKDKIDGELKQLPKTVFKGRAAEDTNAPLDYLLKAVATRMKSEGLDPFKMPFIRETFSKRIMMINFKGEVRIAEGTLAGLSTIHRTGDIELNLENGTLTLEANLGFGTLIGNFVWGVHFMKIRQYGSGEVILSRLALSVLLSQKMEKGQHPVINRLKITDFGRLHIDINGMGPFNFIFESIVNLIANAMKSKMVKKIEDAVKKELQGELKKISLTF